MPAERRVALYCLLQPAGAAALDDVREHYRLADPRVEVLQDRRVGQRRRTGAEAQAPRERRGGTDRRRFVVPRRLAPLPEALAARTGPVAWIQRLLPVGPATEALEFDEVVAAVRAGHPEAPTELYWRTFQRLHSRLSVLLGDPRDVETTVSHAFGRVLDALEDGGRRDEPFDELLYAEVDAAAEEVLDRRDAAHGVPEGGLEVQDPALDEPVHVVEPDPMWTARARAERDRVLAALGDDVAAVEHIGGTVLPDVPGRDTIDLLVGLHELPAAAAGVAELVAAGFEDCGDGGVPDRRYLRRRTHSQVDLHLVEHGGVLWHDAVGLRDFLLRNSLEAQRWGDVKRAAARTSPASTTRYCDLRRLTLEELLGRARAESLPRVA